MEAFKYYSQKSINNSILSAFLEHSIISIIDSMGRVEFASDSFCEILGSDFNCLIGKPLNLLRPNMKIDEIHKNIWFSLKKGVIWKGVLSGKSDNNNPFWLDTTIIPVKDDIEKRVKYLVKCDDVTKNYELNTKLLESALLKDKYRLIFQSICAGIIIIADAQGYITEWNKGAEDAFGYSKIEILGKKLSVLISKESAAKNIINLISANSNNKEDFEEYPLRTFCLNKKGEEFSVELSLSSFDFNGGLFYCAVMLDLSKRNKRNSTHCLTSDIESIPEKQIRNLGSFHRAMHQSNDLFKKLITSSGNRALGSEGISNKGKLVSYDFAKGLNVPSKHKRLDTNDFKSIINNVLRMLNGSENFDHIEFSINIDESLDFISDYDLVYSILQNLIHNSVKYSKAINEELFPYIDITVMSLDKMIEINLKDNGQGIATHCIDKIFNLYYRANVKDVPGNGLGLYIVKNIIEELHGKIQVESTLNKGTHFKILLPNSI